MIMKKNHWLILMVMLILSGTGFIVSAMTENNPFSSIGVFSVSDDPIPTPYLGKGITCEYAGPNCGDEGPEVLDFNINDTIYAYSLFYSTGGYDYYGRTIKHVWFFNGAERGSIISDPCQEHCTSWCAWSSWDIGTDFGAGQGIVRFYIDDTYIGVMNDLFNVIDPTPPSPVISITTTSWVVASQASAVICWLGAAMSGFKYLGLL